MGRDFTALERQIYRNNFRSSVAEHAHAIRAYNPIYMIGLTCKYWISEDDFRKAVKTYLHRSARRLAKLLKNKGIKFPHRHLKYEYWYDYQPKRKDEVYHAHVFVGIENMSFDDAKILDDSHDNLFWFEWNYGQVEVEKFNDKKGRVIYSSLNHKKWFDGIGCSNGQHKCSGNKCAYTIPATIKSGLEVPRKR